jgi:SAM-dependent methyltransferase
MHYYEYVSIDADDQTIALHPLIDACNASIAYRLLEHLGIPCEGKTALDLGAGTGQVSRFLKGIPGLLVEACDVDPQSQHYFRSHPELKDVPFHVLDVLESELPKRYDAVVCRGLYHHFPKGKRPKFLKLMSEYTQILIIADEGIREYASEAERVRNCEMWYGYVIGEAKRRGIPRLADMEAGFLEHERFATADDGLDFKESPSHLLEDARAVGLKPLSIDRQGPWQEKGGGFFTATFRFTHRDS